MASQSMIELEARLALLVLFVAVATSAANAFSLSSSGPADKPPVEYIRSDQPEEGQSNAIKFIAQQIESNALSGASASEQASEYLRRAKEVAQRMHDTGEKPMASTDDSTGLAQYDGIIDDLLGELKLLTQLADPKASYNVCSSHFVGRLVGLVQVLWGDFDNFLKLVPTGNLPSQHKKLFSYIVVNAPVQYKKCYDGTETKYAKMRMIMDKRAESQFDKFISKGKEQDATDAADQRLTKTALQIDFVNGQLKMGKMMKALNTYTNNDDDSYNSVANTALRFLEDTCSAFQNTLTEVFIPYNMARALNGQQKCPKLDRLGPGFTKLNEYIRLCNQMMNPNSHLDVKENINLNSSKNIFKAIKASLKS